MYTILLSSFIFISCPSNFSLAVFSGPGSNSGSHNAFRCQFHLVYFNPELFLPFPLSSCS